MRVVMLMNDMRDNTGAVGIVVQGGAEAERRPRAVAFVYGGKIRPAPSLPYGRWKKAATAA